MTSSDGMAPKAATLQPCAVTGGDGEVSSTVSFVLSTQFAYVAAPLTNMRIGYNTSAGCVTLMVPRPHCGAVNLMNDLKTAVPETRVEGTACNIRKNLDMTVAFEAETRFKHVAAIMRCS